MATRKANKADVLKLIRAKWPKGYIDEGRPGPSNEERATARARVLAIIKRREELAAARKELNFQAAALLAAAQRVLADRDAAALHALGLEAERGAEHFRLCEEDHALLRERETCRAITMKNRKYQVCDPSEFCTHIIADADTLDELVEIITKKKY